MDEKEANIDLLFRNGLKDYEVLPPSEVWEKISPAIREQQRPYLILRAVAMIAVLITLGLLTFTFNREVSTRIADSTTPVTYEPESPQVEMAEPIVIADAGTRLSLNPVTSVGAQVPELFVDREIQNTSTGNIAFEFPSQGLREAGQGENRSGLISLKSPVTKSISLEMFTTSFSADIPVVPKKDRWTIAALLSPTYLSAFQTGSSEVTRQLGSTEQPLISYAGGLTLSYKLSKRLSVLSGLYYSSFGNELSGITSFGGFQDYGQAKGNRNFEVMTTNGTVYTNNPDVYLIDNLSDSRTAAYFDRSSFDPTKASLQYLGNTLTQNLSYLELPLIIRYKFVDRAVDFNLIGGLSSNLLVNNTVYTDKDGGKYEVGRTEGMNNITFSSSLGMGMEYSFSRNLSFNFEPTFRYFLNPLSNVSGVRTHPYSFGIFSGISFKF